MGFLRLAVLSLLLAACQYAQTSSSSISGTVTDSSGAVVPGAAVTLTNEATGIAAVQKTTEAGVYSFPSLPVGPYTIQVEKEGFRTARRQNNALEVGTPLAVDVTLEVGETSEVVTVEARAETLQTSDASIGNVVTQQEVAEMPLNGRNPLALLVLEPGVVQLSGGASGTGVHVNGSRDMASNTTIDGIDANESSVSGASKNVYMLNPDSVQEYKVTTNNASAEQGRNSGAGVSVATRSGTNKLHGTLFEYFRNTALNSNEFFANALGTPKPDIKLNQFGFEVGGPIKRNRTFFFGSLQNQRINFAQPIDQVYGSIPTLYTPSALAGVYRYWVNNPRSPLVIGGQTITRNTPLLVDPKTGEYRAGVRNCASPTDLNCIASYNMYASDPTGVGPDPAIRKLLQTMPAVNSYSVGDGLNTGGYLWNPPARRRGPSFMVRIDHTINSKHNMFARYLGSSNDTLGGDPNNSRPQLYPGFPPLGEVFRSSKNIAVSFRSAISTRMVNELTMGMSRFGYLFTQGEANPDFPNVPAFSRASGTGLNNVDAPYRNVPRSYRIVTTPQILDNFTYLRSSHIIKAGFNFRFYRHNDQRGQPGGATVTPLLTFDSGLRAPPGFVLPAQATSSVAGINSTDFTRLQGSINDLMGIPTRLSQTFLGDLDHDTFMPFKSGDAVNLWNFGHRIKQYNMYLQDEWKVRRSFTINAGLRWEVNPAPTEAAGRVYVPNKAIEGSQGPVTFVKADQWYQRDNLRAFAPRLSLSWKIADGTVIRTGYSMAFDPISSFQITAAAGRVPGLTTTCEARVGGSVTPGCTGVPDVRYSQGFPTELQVPSVRPSDFLTLPADLQANAPAATVFDPQLRLPTVHQWNFTIQRELPREFVAQIAYVGHRGTRLYRGYDINQINSDGLLPSFLAMQNNVNKGCRADGSNCPVGVTGASVPLVTSGIVTSSFVNSSTTLNNLNLNAAGTFAGRVEQTTLAAHLRPNQQFGTITFVDSGGDSYYHSLQATLRRRFRAGLLFGMAYTLAKSIDDQSVDPIASSSGGGLSTTNTRTPSDIRNWRLERGRSDFDRTHVLNTSWIYELPVGKGKRVRPPRALEVLAGNWTLNGILMLASGSPFSVRSGVRTSNYSHESRAILTGPKPEAGLWDVPGIVGPVYFKDTSAFAIPEPGGVGGGRNIFEGPAYWNFDLGVTKMVYLRESVTVQLRGEFFNALNHPNFDNPYDASAGSASFRSTLFAQTCCATVAPPSTRAIVDTGESGRVIQFALRLRF